MKLLKNNEGIKIQNIPTCLHTSLQLLRERINRITKKSSSISSHVFKKTRFEFSKILWGIAKTFPSRTNYTDKSNGVKWGEYSGDQTCGIVFT